MGVKVKLSTNENILAFDVYLITGSFCSAYEDIPWINDLKELIRSIFEITFGNELEENNNKGINLNISSKTFFNTKTIKLLGICFGHQIIAHTVGEMCGKGVCCKNPEGWTLGVDSLLIDGKDAINYWDFLQNKLAKANKETSLNMGEKSTIKLSMNYVHQDHIPTVPTLYGIKSLGDHPSAKHSYGFYNGTNLLTFQGHPEFNLEVMQSILNKLQSNNVISNKNVDLQKINDSLQVPVNIEELCRAMISFCLP